jgi:hypothetical protein
VDIPTFVKLSPDGAVVAVGMKEIERLAPFAVLCKFKTLVAAAVSYTHLRAHETT